MADQSEALETVLDDNGILLEDCGVSEMTGQARNNVFYKIEGKPAALCLSC